MLDKIKFGRRKYLTKTGWTMFLMFVVNNAFAAEEKLGSVAANIYSNFGALAKLITAGAYIGGLAFAVGAIMKFKAHKDNPTQVPIGTPIALVMIAACLLFLPSILGVAGESIFGGGSVAGASGDAWTTGKSS